MSRYAIIGIIMQCVFYTFVFAGNSEAQKKSINNIHVAIELNNATIESALKQIENVTDFQFVYKKKSISSNRKVTMKSAQVSLGTILRYISKESNLQFRRVNETIYVRKREENAAELIEEGIEMVTSLDQTISGTVVDENGEGLPGANVIIVNTASGVVTDADGNYKISVPDDASSLIFSYVGYVTKEVEIAGRSTIDIRLSLDIEALSEIIVVGYGTQKKVNLTGATTTIQAKDIQDRPTNNILKSLQGTVPGVTIIARPGGGTSINIRGRGNLGTSSPLYIVDQLQVDEGFFNNMDPFSIESISFLRDAAASAIYGAKAAYGVVLVTTKNAKTDQLQVSYNGSFGFQSATYIPKVVDSWQHAEMYRTAEINSGVPEAGMRFTEVDVQNYRSGTNLDVYPNSNWFDLVLDDKSSFTKHNLNFSGGANKVNYVLGLGYQRNEELTPGEGTNRYNFSAKSTSEVKPWLDIIASVNYIQSNYDRENGSSNFTTFLNVPPTTVGQHSNGQWGTVRDKNESALGANFNPLRNQRIGGRGNSVERRLLGKFSTTLKPIEGLSITNQFGFNYNNFRSFSFTNRLPAVPSFFSPGTLIPGTGTNTNQLSIYSRYNQKLIYDGWINYEKTQDQHFFKVLLGTHADSYKFEDLSVGRRNFASNEINAISGGSTDPVDQSSTTGNILEETTLSYFGRLNYVFSEKYLLEANFRSDASSRFAKDGRWGFFPSLSAGWLLSEEAFIPTSDWMSLLKLRGSWGQSGNINNVGFYDTYSTFISSGTTIIGGQVVPLLSEGRIGNLNLTWETTTTTDIGLDLEIERGLLNVSIDYYNRITEDILIRANDVLAETGLSASNIPAQNVGSVRNKGIEVALLHQNTINDFTYSAGFNFAKNTNEILDLGSNVDRLPPSGYFVFEKGHSIGDFYMLEADGLYSSEDISSGEVTPFGATVPEEGMVKFVDQLTVDTNDDGIPDERDGIINDDDRTIVANDVPSFTYGLNLEASYKGFTLSAVAQGVTGVKVYLDNEASQAFFDGSVPRKWQIDNWTPNNQDAQYPKLFKETDGRFVYNSITSSYWLFDASYFRVKNITLSYSIPKAVLNTVKLNRARVYVSGENLVTIRGDKRMKDFDPERATGRAAALGLKVFTFGVSVTL